MIGTSLLFSGSIAGLLGPGDFATPTAGYSLRPLSVSYSGAVVRVRRSGDNAEKDFNASGIADGQLSDFLNVFTESGHILNVYEHFKREFTESPLTFYNFEDVSLVCNCIEESSGLIAYDALQNMVSHQVAVYTDIDYPTIDDPSLVSPCNDGQADELNAFDDLLNLTTQNDGYVVTWYDQFGSNDATQATASAQPKIWDSTTGLVTENGKPALDFDGSNDYLQTSVFTASTQPITRILVAKQNGSGYLIDGSSTNRGVIGSNPSSSLRRIFAGTSDDYAVNITGNQELLYALFDGANSELFVNSSGLGAKSVGTGGLDRVTIGTIYDASLSTTFVDAQIQEIMIYASDQSANRTKIEDNINDYYDIY